MKPRSRKTTTLRFLAVAMVVAVATAACASDDGDDFAGSGGEGGGAGSVTLLEQPWIDLQVENEIAKQLLEELGYTANVKSVSVELGATSMETGEIDAYLGNWWPSQEPSFGELIDDGKVEVVSTILEGTQYAPAIPGDQANELGISSLEDLDGQGDEFDKTIYGIEPGTPGNATINQMIKDDAYGLGDWKLVASGTPAMLTQVQRSVKAGDPIVFLAWSPHWMTVQFDTVFLEDPGGAWGGAGEIRTITREGYADEAPDIVTLLGNLSFTPEEAGQFYFDHDKEGKSLDEIASAWIEANPDKVKTFLDGVNSAEGDPAESVIFG